MVPGCDGEEIASTRRQHCSAGSAGYVDANVNAAGCKSLRASLPASLLASQRLRQRYCRRAIPWIQSLGNGEANHSGRFLIFL